MLRQLTRLPLRRTLHTSARDTAAGARAHRARVALGASAVAGAYLAWSLSTQRVALDAKPEAQVDGTAHPLSADTASSRKAVHAAVSEHTHDAFTPPEASTSSDPVPTSFGASHIEDAEDADNEDDEGEGGSQASSGAYNPETGEINWDCPCLGGMAHGPCGPQFREAFSCFIFSEQEPKGIDCVEKFKGMQDCFREHPEVYAAEIMDDDEEEDGVPAETALVKDTPSLAAESSPSDLPSSEHSTATPAPASA